MKGSKIVVSGLMVILLVFLVYGIIKSNIEMNRACKELGYDYSKSMGGLTYCKDVSGTYCKDVSGNIYTVNIKCSGFMSLGKCTATRIKINDV